MRSASYSSGTVSSTPPTFAAHGSSSWPPRSVEHQLVRLVDDAVQMLE